MTAPDTNALVVDLDSHPGAASAVIAEAPLTAVPLVITARSSRFDFDSLEDLARAGVHHGRAFGIKPSDIVRPPASPPAASRRWYRAGHHAPGAQPTPGAVTRDSLNQAWTLVSVFGHGDGMHINMDGVVLCGVTRGRETVNSVPVPAGCSATDDRCKKQTVVADVYRAQDLNCRVLLLLSCNSLSLASQLYPSDNSIAVAAWAAGAAEAVIGTTRQMILAPGEVEDAGQRVLSGAPLGEVVCELNAERLASGRNGYFVLLGDPNWRAPVEHAQPLVGRQPEPSGPDQTASRALPTRDLLSRVADGRRLTIALRIVCRETDVSSSDTTLRRLESLRSALEEQIWVAEAHQQLTGGVPPVTHRRLNAAIQDWQDECRAAFGQGKLLSASPGGDVGDRLTRALALFAAPTPQLPSGSICDRCRGRVMAQPLRFPGAASGQAATRVALECAACGPRGNVLLAPPGGTDTSTVPELSVALDPTGSKGSTATFTLRYSTESTLSELPLLLQVRDKSRADSLPEFWYELSPGQTLHTIHYPIPPDSGSDIFSARAVVISAGSLEMLRCVFPVC
ncbi:hypothetical protein [Streptomyces sp. NPDC019224]|uniref:hypothetical protein n=1 Tax=Streptomyces sp. NPDC019224 TaxID=3154484 RepID=UPI00340A3AC5